MILTTTLTLTLILTLNKDHNPITNSNFNSDQRPQQQQRIEEEDVQPQGITRTKHEEEISLDEEVLERVTFSRGEGQMVRRPDVQAYQ